MRVCAVLLLSLSAVSCVDEAVNARRHSDRAVPDVIYIWDAFGECYALIDGGRHQSWTHMQKSACESGNQFSR